MTFEVKNNRLNDLEPSARRICTLLLIAQISAKYKLYIHIKVPDASKRWFSINPKNTRAPVSKILDTEQAFEYHS